MPAFFNLTRDNEIGANCYYLDLDGQGIVFDAGMHPKALGSDAMPLFDKLRGKKVSAVFVSHAHYDHIGALPLLMHYTPEAKIFLSEPTYYLADALLHNSVNVMKRQRLDLGLSDYPLYTHGEVTALTKIWQACHLNKLWSTEGFPIKERSEASTSFEFYDAGHILGSVAVKINTPKHTVLYTGDLNFKDQTLMQEAQLPETGIDTLIIETTRGAQPTEKEYSRDLMIEKLIEGINETLERRGSVLLPIFAMGKTQELMTVLHQAQQEGKLPSHEIYLGGLGKVFTLIYDRFASSSKRFQPGLQIFDTIHPQVFDYRKIESFKPRSGPLYLLPSGMMTSGTTSNRVASHFLNKKENSIFFVGYTDPDSPAGKLRATPQGEDIMLNPQSGEQKVRCEIKHFDFTSHALREDLLNYIIRLQPKNCLLVHGDPPALEWFQSELAQHAPKINTIIPQSGEEILLR